MKLKMLKGMIDQAVERAGESDPDVEVCLGEKAYEIVQVGQFHIVPDVIITIEPMT
jgi:hypothetical protein